MTLVALRQQADNLLARDRQAAALDLILQHLKEDAHSRADFIQQQGRLAALERDDRRIGLSYDEKSRGRNEIRTAIRGLVMEITADELRTTPLPTSPRTASPDTSPTDADFAALEQQGLRRQAELLLQKINRTREALALEDDPTRQLRYETQLDRWEQEWQTLKQRAGL